MKAFSFNMLLHIDWQSLSIHLILLDLISELQKNSRIKVRLPFSMKANKNTIKNTQSYSRCVWYKEFYFHFSLHMLVLFSLNLCQPQVLCRASSSSFAFSKLDCQLPVPRILNTTLLQKQALHYLRKLYEYGKIYSNKLINI